MGLSAGLQRAVTDSFGGNMYYSDDIVEEVRSRNDIVDVILGYVKLQRKGSSYFGLCPFHDDHSPDNFSVYPPKNCYTCFFWNLEFAHFISLL